MWLDFSHPWLLTLIPVCAAAVLLVARRYPSGGRKARISHALRQCMLLLTVLALAGAGVSGGAKGKAAWILVDASDSMARRQDEVQKIVREAIAANGDGQRLGVIAFGRDAMVEAPLSDSPSFHGVSTAIDASASDLEQALALAGALLPSDASGGVAVISDGLLDAADASALQARGVAVNAWQLPAAQTDDAQITRLELPGTAYQGQSIAVTVTVHSTKESPATIVLSANRVAAATREVRLRKGENTFVFRDVAAQPGVVTYEAQVVMPGDGVARNDRAGAYVAVSGAPAVLLVEGQSGAGGELGKLLRAAGMQVETVAPSMMSGSAAELRAYQAVALVNVDADSLTDGQLSALDAAAKELGVGVAVFGGDSSYALGGYRGSALEELLPVTIDVKNRAELPSTALVLVIDKSGSMTDGQYGVSRLDVAKEAACRAVEVLTEQDQAGVIAFDDEGKWVVPLTNASDIPAMQAQIGTIRPGGGTAFYTPLAMAYQALDEAVARYKHIIFLTDGQSGDAGYESLAEGMAAKGITLTTVAVGDGADVDIMQRLAQLGGGRAYAAGQFDNVPKIFTKETMLIAGTYVQNRTFTPIVTDESLTDFPGFPALDGYLATTEKAMATVSLVSDREDPLLAWWQYGAGRVLCWTSDVQGAWTQSFLAWDDAVSFFAGMVAHVLPSRTQEGEMLLEDGRLSYTAEEPMEGAQAVARVLRPDGSMEEVALEQTTATRYEADVETGETGAYAVQVELKKDGETVASLDGGAVVPYSREYDLCASDSGALQALVRDTGGVLAQDAAQWLSFPETSARTRHSLRPWLLLAALLMLVADVAWLRLGRESAGKRKPAPERKKRSSGRKRPEPRPTAPAADPTQTSEQLWQNLQKKHRL